MARFIAGTLLVTIAFGCAQVSQSRQQKAQLAQDAGLRGCLPGEEELFPCESGEQVGTEHCKAICRNGMACLVEPSRCRASRPLSPVQGYDDATK